MMKVPAAAGASPVRHARTTPLTGVVIGTGISLMLWALILAIVFAVR